MNYRESGKQRAMSTNQYWMRRRKENHDMTVFTMAIANSHSKNDGCFWCWWWWRRHQRRPMNQVCDLNSHCVIGCCGLCCCLCRRRRSRRRSRCCCCCRCCYKQQTILATAIRPSTIALRLSIQEQKNIFFSQWMLTTPANKPKTFS